MYGTAVHKCLQVDVFVYLVRERLLNLNELRRVLHFYRLRVEFRRFNRKDGSKWKRGVPW